VNLFVDVFLPCSHRSTARRTKKRVFYVSANVQNAIRMTQQRQIAPNETNK